MLIIFTIDIKTKKHVKFLQFGKDIFKGKLWTARQWRRTS